MNISYHPPKTLGQRAQAIVEFAIVLPILMALLVGILEVGRLIFMYAAISNASREAVRYASAYGLDDSGYLRYQYCKGITDMAKRSAFFTPLTVTITYDTGPGTSSFDTCTPNSDGVDTGVAVTSGQDRVQVEVKADYSPMLTLLPIDPREIESTSARTIVGLVELGSAPGPATTATSVPTRTATSTRTPTPNATFTSTSTPTATYEIDVYTFTPLPTSTPTLIPSGTPTATSTGTATPTVTATGTSTPSSSCDTITASDISVIDNTNFMSMTITNPYIDVEVLSVTLVWNNHGALGSPDTLTLDGANNGTTFWSGLNDSSGTITLTPPSPLTLPGNDTKSTVTFVFLQNYDASKMSGTTTITINFSTPKCSPITKTAK